MKKNILAASMLLAVSLSLSAKDNKTVTPHKFFDNWYIGANAGITLPVKTSRKTVTITPTSGIRLGKNFTSVFGVVADLELYTNFSSNEVSDTKCFVDATNLSLLGSCNLSNAISHYNGEPRTFEFFLLGGLGWGHPYGVGADNNYVTGKVAFDAAWNLGKDKEWQLYVEPALTIAFEGYTRVDHKTTCYNYNWALDPHRCQLSAKIGVNYKFKSSNGHHNFTCAYVTSQDDKDNMNATINSLRAEIQAKTKELADADEKIAILEQQLRDAKVVGKVNGVAPSTNSVVTNITEVVAFELGSALVSKSEETNVLKVAAYMLNNPESEITIYGYTSPDATPEQNERISQQRADAVRDLLVYKFGIPSERLTSIGLASSDRLAVEPTAKRVVVFTDTTKK